MNNNQKKALQIGIEMAASESSRLAQVKSNMTHKAIAALEAHTQLNAQGRVTRGLAWAEEAESFVRDAAKKYGTISDGAVADCIAGMADDFIASGIQAVEMGVQKKARLAKERKMGVSRK